MRSDGSGVPPCHSMRSSLLTRRWREMDSNFRFLVARPSNRYGRRDYCLEKRKPICWGTEGSNPAPSSGESGANSTPRLRQPASCEPRVRTADSRIGTCATRPRTSGSRTQTSMSATKPCSGWGWCRYQRRSGCPFWRRLFPRGSASRVRSARGPSPNIASLPAKRSE